MIFQPLFTKMANYLLLFLSFLIMGCVIFILIQHLMIVKLKYNVIELNTKISQIENQKELMDKNFEILQKQINKLQKIKQTSETVNIQIISLKDKNDVIKISNDIIRKFNNYSSF